MTTTQERRGARSLTLRVPGWPGHRPGQHVDVRLTASDGYQAVRSYSLAQPEAGEKVTITVECVQGGEVSPYLVQVARPADRMEVRGPIGGYFVWEVPLGGPLFLIAGGSGVVPLMCMLRHRAARASSVPARLLYSARSPEQLLYGTELDGLHARRDGFEFIPTYTRAAPEGWGGYRRRVDQDLLRTAGYPPTDGPLVYVCGPTPFVEAVAEQLVQLGHDPVRVKTERFGPSGGTS